MGNCHNPRTVMLRRSIDIGGTKYLAYSDKVGVNGLTLTHVQVPCGKCADCIDRIKSELIFRMENEKRMSKTAFFVTLTYDNEHVPYDKWGNKILVKEHLKGFFKRLRINHVRNKKVLREMFWYGLNPRVDKISYLGCGEYGSRGRPHYHAIIFNVSKELIDKSWGMGIVDCQEAGEGSIAYVVKYLEKKKGERGSNWKVPKEFRVNSGRLGMEYINRMKVWHRLNPETMYCHNGKYLVPMSRYYREKIWIDEDERSEQTKVLLESVEQKRREDIRRLGSIGAYNDAESERKRVKNIMFDKKKRKQSID